MGELPGGQWAAFEVAIIVSRQNGKNVVLEARQLGGLFVLNEDLQIHTSHQFKTTEEHALRVTGLIQNTPELDRQVARITASHGDEGIQLKPRPTQIMGSDSSLVIPGSSGARLRFLARSRTSARGFSADTLFYDEAMVLAEQEVQASLPTMSARRNPQLWYTASAGERNSFQLGRVRRRGIAGLESPVLGDPQLCFLEWSINPHHEFCKAGCTEHDDPDALRSWARANPGLGIRITADHIGREMRTMSPEGFAIERLGVGDWPADENGWEVISEPAWNACQDDSAERPRNPVCIAADVTPDQSAGTIAVAGLRRDGRIMSEIPQDDHRPGTSWMVPRLKELKKRHRPCAIVIDPNGPASCLLSDAATARLEIETPTSAEIGQAFGVFYVAVGDRQFVHTGQADLRAAIAGAAERDMGDGGHAWARKHTSVDISPAVAVTLAVWGHGKWGRRRYDVLKSVPG